VIEQEPVIFTRFARSLTHLLRGDLSVISNELAYLSSVIDKRELLVSQKRCAAIAEVLSTVSSLGAALRKRPTALNQVADTFGVATHFSQECMLDCDCTALARCVGALRQALGPWSATLATGQNGATELSIVAPAVKAPLHYHDSVSSFVFEQGADDVAVLMSAAVDMIIRGHGWSASCSAVGGQCEVLIKVPAAQSGGGF
jgi:hypothetical protein